MSKRILVLHFPSMGNYGTAMMGIVALHMLRKLGHHDWQFAGDYSEEHQPGALERELNSGSWVIQPWKRLPLPAGNNPLVRKIKRLQLHLRQSRQLADEFAGVLILGGDDLSEYYGKKPSAVCQRLLELGFWSKQVPVFLLGQTIGPFTSWRKTVAKRCLNKCHIYVRDPWSVGHLNRDIRLNKNVHLSADLALLDLPRQHETGLFEEVAKQYDLVPNEYVCIIVSGLWKQYTSDVNEYLNTWRNTVAALLQHPQMKNKKVCLLPHTVPPYADERDLISKVASNLTPEDRARVAVIDEVLGPTRTRLVLGHGLMTITGRMHAAISTYQMGRPAIAVAYSVKYDGVIGRSLGRSDLVVNGKSPQAWADGGMTRAILDKVDYAFVHRERLCNEVSNAVAYQQSLALNALRDVISRISSGLAG